MTEWDDTADDNDADDNDADENDRKRDGSHPSARASEGYDALADRAGGNLSRRESPWGDSYFQQYYSWPATRETLPTVDRDDVLVAGCGRGDHVEWFLDRDAAVVGVDVSERAVRTARDRFGDDAAFHRADVTEPLDFADDTFDLVFSHLALDHVEDWRPVFEEFRRVLVARGTLVFTVVHPQYFRDEHGVTSAYETEEIVVSWSGAEIPAYHRPTSEILGALLTAGFDLEAFEEPKPREEFAEYAPERYEDAMESPQVLCIRARA